MDRSRTGIVFGHGQTKVAIADWTRAWTGHGLDAYMFADNSRTRNVRDHGKAWLIRGRGKKVEYLWKVSLRYAFHAETAQTLHGSCLDDSVDVARTPSRITRGPLRGR